MKVEMKASEARVLGQMESVRDVVEHLGSSTLTFPLNPSHIDSNSIDAARDSAVVAPPTNEATDLP